MNFKRMIAILAVAVMMAAFLCGCNGDDTNDTTGGTESKPTETTAPVIPTTTAPTEVNTDITFTVTVVDQNDAPVANVILQFCDEANCKLPVSTDDNGVVTATYAPSEYHVTLTELPAGYTSDETTFYFEGDSTEMTIVLTAAETGE